MERYMKGMDWTPYRNRELGRVCYNVRQKRGHRGIMCGRYYVNEDTVREIEKIIRRADQKLRQEAGDSAAFQVGDIYPAQGASILAAGDRRLCCKRQRWGFPGFEGGGKRVIYNARSESVLEKKIFRESVEYRRIAIPAAWFYEWSRNKEKNIFYRKDQPALYMAGFYNCCQNEERFVILTTAANESVQPIHDRMPLVLERDEIMQWIFDRERTEAFLRKKPCPLERKTEFEQMSLF